MFSVTLLAVLVKYKKDHHLYKNESIYFVLAYKTVPLQV